MDDQPGTGFIAEVGQPVQVSVIGARCGDPSGTSVTVTANGTPIALTGRGDGLYNGTYTPTAEGPVTIRTTAGAAGASDTQTVSGTIPMSIVAGGPPVGVAIVNPGDDALLRFSGQAGRRVSLKIGPTCCQTTVTIKNPDGSTLASALTFTSGGFIDTKTLPQSGSYTILVDAAGTATGSVTLQLYDVPPDAGGPIVAGGSPVTATVTTPGQNAALTFTGQTGQRVSLKIGPTCCQTTVTIKNPDGSTLASALTFTSGGFIDTRTLPQSGSYTILVDAAGTATGSVTLQLYDVPPDAGGPIVAGGSPVTATVTTPGQNAALTFAGQAGRRVSLKIGPTCCQTTVTIVNPDGSTLASALTFASGGFIDARILPQSGIYTILVDPAATATGSATLQLYDLPPDVTGPIVPGGSPVTVTLTAPGQNALLNFSGQAGQRMSLKIGPTCCQTTVTIVSPDGSTRTSVLSFTSGGFVEPKTLPQNGTYTVLVDPAATATGSVTLQLYDVPPDVTGPIVPGGSPVTVTLTAPGHSALLSFSGQAGRRVSLKIGPTCCQTTVTIKNPDGSTLTSAVTFASGGFIDTKTLPQSGTYSILVVPATSVTGSVTLQLYDVPPDVTGPIVSGGSPVTVTLTTPGQNALLTFTGQAGQPLTLKVGPSCCVTTFTIKSPDGSTLALSTFSTFGGTVSGKVLPQSGPYTIAIDPQGVVTGSVTVTLSLG